MCRRPNRRETPIYIVLYIGDHQSVAGNLPTIGMLTLGGVHDCSESVRGGLWWNSFIKTLLEYSYVL